MKTYRLVMHRKLPIALALSCAVSGTHGMGFWPSSKEARTEAATAHPTEASAYRQQEDSRSAMIELKKAVRANPGDAAIRHRLGQLYLDLGDPGSAEKEFRRALELDAGRAQTQQLLGRAWLMMGAYDEVLTSVSVATSSDAADRAEVHLLHGLAHLGKQDRAAARQAFHQALAEWPDSGQAQVGLARAALLEGELDTAEERLRQARAAGDVDPAEILALEGDAALAREDFAAAERAFEHALTLSPQEVWRRRDVARAQIPLGKYQEANAHLEAVLRSAPGDLKATYLRSLSAYRQKDFDTAARLAAELLKENGGFSPAVFISGATHYYLGRHEQAVSYLKGYVRQAPADPAGRRLLGATLLQLGEPVEAYAVLEPLAQDATAGADVELLALLGEAAMHAGQIGEAEAFYGRAVELRPDDARLRGRSAAMKIRLGNEESGFTELENLVESNPDLTALELSVLQERVRRREFDTAIMAARRYQTRHPDQPEGWAMEGLARFGRGEIAEARAAFQRALALEPGHADAAAGLAEAHLRAGEPDLARRVLESALERKPDDLKTLINLSRVEMQAGRTSQAAAWLDRAAKFDPATTEARLDLAQAYLDVIRPVDALALTQEIGSMRDPRMEELRGRAELQAARPEAAIRAFQNLVGLRPDSLDAKMLLAQAYEEAGEMQPAHETLQDVLARDPEHFDARVAQTRVRLLSLILPSETEQLRPLMTEVRTLYDARPTDARVGEIRGILALVAGMHDEAVALLEAAHEARNDGATLVRLAQAQRIAARPDDAVATLEERLSGFPQDIRVRLTLAKTLLAGHAFERAAAELESILAQDPERADIRPSLAWALMRAGRLEEAEAHARAAYTNAATARDPMVLHTMGVIYMQEGHIGEALALLEQAMQASVVTPTLRFHYARALALAGNDDEARRSLESVLAAEEPFAERDSAKTLLSSLAP